MANMSVQSLTENAKRNSVMCHLALQMTSHTSRTTVNKSSQVPTELRRKQNTQQHHSPTSNKDRSILASTYKFQSHPTLTKTTQATTPKRTR